MKKNLTMMVILTIMSVCTTSVFAQFAGGAGTVSSPYQIANRQQLEAVRDNLSKCFVLVADIDLAGANWTPIGGQNEATGFTGVFDGNNHLITNLTIDTVAPVADSMLYLALFSVVNAGATIKNVHLFGGSITVQPSVGRTTVGSIVGYANTYGTGSGAIYIEKCSSNLVLLNDKATGNIYTGGIVGDVTVNSTGQAVNITVSGCAFNGLIVGSYRVGGIAGYFGSAKQGGDAIITNCYVNADIYSTKVLAHYLGGIAPNPSNGSSSGDRGNVYIENCFAAGWIESLKISTDDRVGGIGARLTDPLAAQTATEMLFKNNLSAQDAILGGGSTGRIYASHSSGGLIKLENNYALDSMHVKTFGTHSGTGATNSGTGRSKSIETLKTKAFYEDSLKWNVYEVWDIREGQTLPFHVWESAPVIASAVGPNLAILNVVADGKVAIYKKSKQWVDDTTFEANLTPVRTVNVLAGDFIVPFNTGEVATGDTLVFYTLENNIDNEIFRAPSFGVVAVVGAVADPSGVVVKQLPSTVSLNVYPNPVKETLNVEGLNINEGAVIDIYSTNGQLVSKHVATGNNTTLNVSNLAKGAYVLKVNGQAVKFVK